MGLLYRATNLIPAHCFACFGLASLKTVCCMVTLSVDGEFSSERKLIKLSSIRKKKKKFESLPSLVRILKKKLKRLSPLQKLSKIL